MDFSKKRGKLKPIFDLNINETLPFKIHPLYNQKKAQHAKICQFLKEKASKARIPFDLLPDHITEVDAIPIAQEKYISEIKKHAQKIAPPPLNIEWENKILNLIPKSVKTKFPNELLNVFKECKTEWNFCLQNLIVKTIIRDLPGALSERYQEKHFKFGGKTEYYAQFLKTKKILEQSLLIMYPFMRLILESSVRAFPLYLVRFDLYRTNEFIRIERLLDVFREDLKRSESLIVDVWYPDLISNFKLPFSKALSSNKRVSKFYNCATNSISMQIVELMRRSIEFLIHIIGSPERTPRIKMELKFESGIVLSPSFDEIFHCYHGMLKSIASISQNLTTLEQIENLHVDNKYVHVQINDWLYKDCHDRLQTKLDDVFQPVRDYIENLKLTYSELFIDGFDISDDNAIDSSQSYEKIKRYKEIGESLSLMVENEYFTVGKIHQAGLINNLKNCCDDLKNEILNSLCLSHEQNSRNICATFETIASKVLKTPVDAAELLEIGSYCLYVKTELVEELRERISISITDMSQLIDLAVLSIDHINVNTKMINWLNEIVPILEKSAIDYETSKYDMEENLLVKTNNLAKKVSDILPYLDILDEMDDINKTLPYLEDIRRLVHWINDCDNELAWINKEETVFKFPVTQFSDLDELKGYVLPFYELMYLLHTWRRRYYSWMDGPFENIDRVKVEHQHEEYYKKFTKIFKDYKNKIKQQIADNNERRFKGLVEDPDPMNLPAPMKLCAQAINELKEWRPWVNLVNIVCNPALRQRHWDDMSKIADLDLTPDAGTTIRKMIKLDLWTEMQKYEIVSIGASKELTLITNLDEMISQWKDVNFNFGMYKDTGIKILTQLDDVQAVLDDHIIKTISMRGSPFVKPFEVQVKSWYEKLLRINSSIDEWIKVQQRWLYFLPLFSSKNIVSQMPQEGHMFQEVDKTYNKYMQVVENNPLVIDSAGEFELLDAMTMANNLLEKISNGVNDYVEKKRLYFPRFFFLSVDEILEILSETENPIKVQPYLKKCFEGINKLEFDDDLNILAMISKECEKIAFRQTVSTKEASGSVEKWLVQVEQQMIESVRSEIELSYLNYASLERELWVKNWEGMVVLCVAQIYWALNVHDCFQTNALQNLNEFITTLKSQLNNLVNIIRSSSLTNINRITIKALIVIDVHAKDVIQELIDKNVNNEADFNWLAQLRYYWEDDNVNVKIINAVVKYAYEYLGNTDRLVITPLTDRCYRTLIGAYSLQLNGAPEGPAGTGKTETTKDLAKAIAKQCIVFNCSDGLDYKGMGRFFKGLASTGAWACFDEFNRIDVEVLSVVAQQILCIIQAIRMKSEKFLFEGTLLTLNQTCYVCITMNPGYAGRSELPDNLKVLFRPVAMMVPDYAMIGEISLYSYGFLDARKLAVKIVAAYRLCSEQLSSQNHYDYGMRAVKSVLSACGGNKMKFPDENEDVLLLRSLTDINLPKFLTKDIPLFNGIVSDLFPGINIPSFDSQDFIEIIKNKCLDLNLELTDYFLLKIIQTNQMMLVRHGFMLVGNPFSGKTSVLKVLYETICCLTNQNDRSFSIVNPKSLTSEQIFGSVDRTTLEWCDGVISKVFREYAKDDRLHRKWIIFDGPVDAVWIENMNTVLDDNKKLCLSSGEVISMSDSMSLIFEVMDLAQASPATVSRCGMIYMESSILGPSPFSKSWVKACNSSWKTGYENLLVDMCDWLFPTLLLFLKKINIPIITGGDMNLVISTLQIVNMVMNDAVSNEEDTKYLKTWIQASFIFGIVWGLGGNLSADSKVKFEEFVRETWKSDQNIPETLEKIDVSIPMEGLLSDYIYQYKQKGNWKHWQEIVKNTKLIDTLDLQQTIIPTADSVKCAYLLDLHVRYKRPMLFVGKTGTGKTFYTRDYIMNKLSIEQYTPVLMTFTVTTSANQTQETLLSKLYKHKGNRYGPRKGKEAIVFIDDMSMPAKEIYGAQPAIELLRQYLDHKHWYHLKTSERIDIVNVLILAAVGPVGGSKQLIYPRLLRHFNIFAVNEFSEDSVMKIFTNILQIGWKRNGFGNDVTPITVSIVNGTLDVYTSVVNNLLPTISKAHYLFNIRDIGRVIQGCLLLKKESADNKKYFVKLWIHETLRVFYDRFTNVSDREWFYSVLKRCTTDHFKEELASMCDNYQDDNGNVTENSLKNLMFGTYLDVESMDDDKKYEEIPNISTFLKKAVDTLDDYNSTSKNKINIVLFQYALEHLSKICRIISIPGGNALLIGVGGSGRQSLTKLASYMIGNSVFQPEITKNYDLNSWRSDIKKLLKQAGGLPKETTFLFSEGQILNEIFLQDIDNLLNSGEVPNLFELDEQQEILELVRLAAQGGNRNLDIHPLNVMSFFIARCRAKLHLCVCLSPVSNTFRDKLRLYPSLINCCTVNWFDDWPEDALLRVAEHIMEDINIMDQVKSASIQACKYFHMNAYKISNDFYDKFQRRVFITSESYINLINLYAKLIAEKQNDLQLAKKRYMNGLDKLNLAAEAVSDMQKELNELKPQLIIMAVKGAEMMEEIERETIEADKATVQVREDEKIANEQAAGAQVLKKDCEADLALAIPILEDAIAALNTLKPTDITLVKSMKNPPAAIKLVMAAVCVMKSIPPDRIPDPANPGRKMFDFWGPSKRLLGDMAFLQSLKEFDKDNIPVVTMVKIRKEYLSHKDFKPSIIAKASTAAEGLCKWVIAMDMYDAVAKVVAPKKAKLQAAEAEFAATMAILEEKKAMVARLEKRVADLNAALEEANLKKQELEEEVQLCINKLYRAEKLIGGLGGEKSRWTSAAENLQNLYDNLAGDILLSCGIISYLSPFPVFVRSSAVIDWEKCIINLEIPFSDNFEFSKVLGSDLKIQNWRISGLPQDQISTDNAVIQDISTKWSLLIDPQGQAIAWLKKMEQMNDLRMLKLSDDDYMKTLQTCIEYGMPALIENIMDDLPAPLDPILMKNTYTILDKMYITIGDEDIEYSPKFRLYMTTKQKNPHYQPEVFIKVTVINFALSIAGLEDQLLGIVVAKERPDLQEKREQLIIETAQNTAELKNIENSILKTLQETKGDILEDEAAIEILDSSKVLSVEILERKKAAKETEIMIDKFRVSYQPIAKHAANVYYSVTDLSNIDPMYQYSLSWYVSLYKVSIEKANKSKELDRRLKFLIDTFTYNLYCNVCRSLFEKDKLMFSFILCSKMLTASHDMNGIEFNFFLTGGISVTNEFQNPFSWLPSKSWDEICRICEIDGFNDFRNSFVENGDLWKHIYDSNNPQTERFPPPWDKLSLFKKLLVIRMLRPDKLTDAITIFIEENLGRNFVNPPPFDIVKSYNESNCLIPIIFILSPGSDPFSVLQKFSEKMGYGKKLNSISLGQGQGPLAKALISQAQAEGGWVCLQNCHLAVSWFIELENVCESFNLTNTDTSFRLWLTTYSTDKFPQSILQSSIKMTNEIPYGLKNNLCRLYTSEPVKDPLFYGGCPENDKTFSKLLYSISFFHSVVQERKKFGPLGWNIPYSFDDSDFIISIKQLQNFLNQYTDVPYVALSYLIGECNYGGRVTDEWDRRLIVTILKEYLNSKIVNDSDYSFSNVSRFYNMPRHCEYQDYLKHIESIPQFEPPEVLGLHMNAGIFCDLNNSMILINALQCVEGESSGNYTNANTDDMLKHICVDIIERLPPSFNLEIAIERFPIDYHQSMNTFLIQEMEKYNKLIHEIVSSLENLQKGISGLLVMTPDMEMQGSYISKGKCPLNWLKISYPSLKSLGGYIIDLIERLKFLNDWCDCGTPKSFWISGFFFTQAFLTAGLQNFARRYSIPIDRLVFDCVITTLSDTDDDTFADSLFVYGLFLSGARWNDRELVLDEQVPKVLNEAMPSFRIYAIEKSKFDEGNRYKCPVYRTPERRGILATTGHSSNFVLSLMLPSDRTPSHWIKRSVAMILEQNE